jgi:multidrug resistance efflux pump
VVHAPADGYVTNLALRKGARVANLPLAPVMAFIDTSDTLIAAAIAQIDARYIAPGKSRSLSARAGRGHRAKSRPCCRRLFRADGIRCRGGAEDARRQPFVVRIRLDDQALAHRLPAGATGTAAIYTDHVKFAHFIRRVLLRQIAILNYVNPF